MTDPTEELLTSLRAAPPSVELLARLRASKPKRRGSFQFSVFSFQFLERGLTWRRAAWIGGLGAAAAWIVVGPWSAPRASTVAAENTPVVAASASAETSQIFLPVESTRYLVSLQPAQVIQQPDQPPQRFVRAVWVDDVTAVGAETDAALHLRRAYEAYVPVSSPVY